MGTNEPVMNEWIRLVATAEVVALLEKMAAQDAAELMESPNKSQTVRRLIVKEARERGLLVPENGAAAVEA